MKTGFAKFLLYLAAFGLIIFLAGLLTLKMVFTGSHLHLFTGLVLFFFGVTALVHYTLIAIDRNNHKKFIQVFLLTTALKLFIYLIIVSIYAFFDPQNAVAFVVLFFSLYLCFTTFELIHLFRFLRAKKD